MHEYDDDELFKSLLILPYKFFISRSHFASSSKCVTGASFIPPPHPHPRPRSPSSDLGESTFPFFPNCFLFSVLQLSSFYAVYTSFYPSAPATGALRFTTLRCQAEAFFLSLCSYVHTCTHTYIWLDAELRLLLCLFLWLDPVPPKYTKKWKPVKMGTSQAQANPRVEPPCSRYFLMNFG